MISWLNTHTLTYLAWGLVNTGLFVQLGQQAQWGTQPGLTVPVVAEQTPVKIEVVTLPDYRLPALKKNFTETLTRPLFVSSRREAPPIPPPPPPPKPTMKQGQFVLLGTVLLDEGNMAILKETVGGKVRQITEGGLINGIKLERVQSDRVMLSQYEETEELRLKVLPSVKTPTAALPQARNPSPVSLPASGQVSEGQPLNTQDRIPSGRYRAGGRPNAAGVKEVPQ